MQKFYLLCSLLFFSITAFSQNTVSGKVTDAETNAPIPGASVVIKGQNKGVITDAEGNFTIAISSASKPLVVSSVGYAEKEVPLSSSGALNIALTPTSKALNDVVVVGYGTTLKKDITGSVAQVNAKNITNTPVTSFETAMQGRAAGVFVQQQNGKLGQAINVTIRGGSSVTAGNQPLYVVDGIPVTSADLSSNGSSTSSLADLNMNDIASIEILKDASAAAIYGSRGSNGVVLITTKKGKAGTSKIEFNYFTGLQNPTGKRDFLNAEQWVAYFEQAAAGAATQDVIYGYEPDYETALEDELDYVHSRFTRYAAGTDDWETAKVNTNWQDEAFQRAPISQYDINVSGGTDKTKVFLSGQYLDQKGILIGNQFKRYSARLNVDQQVRSWLNVGMNINFARSKNYRLSDDDQFSTPLQIVALSPITPVIDPRTGLISGALDLSTGAPNTNYPVYFNPLLAYENAYYHTLVNRTFGNVYANATITPALSFRSEFGMDQLNQTEDSYWGRLTARDIGVPDGAGSYATTQSLHYTTNNYFTYKKTFAETHDLDATLGMSYEDESYDFSEADAEEFPSDAYKKLNAGASKTGASSSSTKATLVSYFARLNYKFNNKYLVALSERIDGSSRFGKNNRYGSFPAASAGWVMSEENFLRDNKFINYLKLKASYGLTGNNEIPDFASRGLYTYAAYGGQAGQVPSQLPNPNLKWETTLGTDLGIEFSILNSRLDFEIAYYTRKTKDLLLDVQVPGTSGFESQLQNVGNLNNKGFEITINSTNIASKNFRWTSSFNFSRNTNKVTNLGGQVLGSNVNKAIEGQPLGVFYAREFAGADPENGDALYYLNTLKTDGTRDRSTTNDYNEASDVVIGNPNPDFIYGLDNAITYKGFDFDVLLQGVYGNQIYNGGGEFMSASGSNGFDNQTTDQLKAWKEPGDITMVPEARLFYANGTSASSRYISGGSYMRVKAVSLGYNLPKNLLDRWKMDHLHIFLRAENLFTFTKYTGWDPEVTADFYSDNINKGYDFYSAPQLKTVTIGFNIGL
ncbi:SusC/RagA family TonB-linked outer membrane protein [Parafilimonas sp.]|uniref:SusC/RagA family TonB-linked outer membrane protein n=1 Tax=Parafilimonas sp. TaxID=1969739 RepID=UPI0039E3089D